MLRDYTILTSIVYSIVSKETIISIHLDLSCAWYKSEDLALFGGGVVEATSGFLERRPSRC